MLMSGDFGDAYTMSQLPRLKDSVHFVGSLLGLSPDYIDLVDTLIDIVFTNCFFFTPFGLYRQGKAIYYIV